MTFLSAHVAEAESSRSASCFEAGRRSGWIDLGSFLLTASCRAWNLICRFLVYATYSVYRNLECVLAKAALPETAVAFCRCVKST